ncbi:MAG: EAL domain-containing protein [Candidatus Sedimenticola endophacoides]
MSQNLSRGSDTLVTHYDALTDLPNLLLFKAHLKHALAHARRSHGQIAVVFLDLDRFKMLNDSFGHAAGDALLKQVSLMLQETLRDDDIVARIGGDEFVILLEDIYDPENAAVAAEKVIAQLANPFELDGREVHISASMGISVYPKDGDDVNELLRNADAAMYRAKEAGRNTYQYYTRELTQQAFEHVLLENSLRKAIETDQLVLLYQPQINLESGELVGVEALVRWLHPDLGMITPERFIPVAEESDLIERVGKWVLNQACQQAAVWFEKGYAFGRMAVNVACRQYHRLAMVEVVESALGQAGLPASLLELEVTENLLMQEAEAVIKQMRALKDFGVRLSIDDFGTGYSSLAYLKALPVGKLKIDRSFVRDIPGAPDDMAICSAIIALANNLQMRVVAEGVENRAQADFLLQAGCRHAQGFLFSEPLTSEALEDYLRLEPGARLPG